MRGTPIAFIILVGCATGGNVRSGCEIDQDCARGQVCVAEQCGPPVIDRVDRGMPRDTGLIMVADTGRMLDAAVPIPDAVVRPILDQGRDAKIPDVAPPIPDMGPDASVGCEEGARRDCGHDSVGVCRRGVQICVEGVWGDCEGDVDPSAEVCNGADDDCNGQIDDGFGVGEACSGVGACGEGFIECRNEVMTRCSTDLGGSAADDGPERCDEVDNDCDGRTDEGLGVGDPCAGGCGPGAMECAAGGGLQCSTDPGGSESVAVSEICNGRDDDCDGMVDEGFELGEPCEGVGVCGRGVFECDEAGAARCSTDPGGTAAEVVDEICNGEDDDCDGVLDEDFEVGGACVSEGACGDGVFECRADGQIGCSTAPGGSLSGAMPERCNGLDDDCDGMMDEGLSLGSVCAAVGQCDAGTLECGAEEQVVCSTGSGGSVDMSAAEDCDGIDNDCDGSVDEAFPIGEECMGAGECGAGTSECGPEGLICSTETGGTAEQSQLEACNGRDDDCDGVTDEGAACGGDTCDTAPGISLVETRLGTTAGLTDDYGDPTCLGRSPGLDQVYRLDVDSGEYVIGVAPLIAGLDLMFWVANACNSIENCVGANTRSDREGAGRPEARTVTLPREGPFYLVVDSFLDQAGGPVAVSVRPEEDGERCGNAIELPMPGRFVGTTAGRNNDVVAQRCPNATISLGPDQVFAIDLDAPTRVVASVTTGNNTNAVLYIVSSCQDVDGTCAGGANLRGNGGAEQVDAQLDAGRWYIVVDHAGNPGGPFLLEVETP